MSEHKVPTPNAMACDPPAAPMPPRQTARAAKTMDLTQGPITKNLLIFAMPTMAGNILHTISGSINSIWVGHLIGETALAATANANIIMFMMMALFFGFGMAATVLIGQHVGQRNHDGALRATGAIFGLATLLSSIIAIIGYFTSDAILRLLATPDAASQLAHDYLQITFIALPATMIMVSMSMASRGAGDAMTPLRFMILFVILDIILNPLLIMGFGTIPSMGISGSAAATAISSIISLLGFIFWIYWRGHPLKIPVAKARYILPKGAPLRFILVRGLPMGAQMMVISGAGLVMIGLVNREGLAMSAAYSVVLQLWNYVQMPALAVGAAVSAMAAQNIGAAKWDRVGKVTRSGIITNIILTGVLILILLAADNLFLSLFLKDGSQAMELAKHILLIASWTFIPFGMSMVIMSTLRANGAVMPPLIILTITMFPVRIGAYFLLYPMLGPDAIWWSFPLSSFCSLALAAWVYRRGHWRREMKLG